MPRYDFTTTRLFVDAPLHDGASVAIRDERANYLLNVLRLRDGDSILVFNGRDGEWRAQLTQTTRRATTLAIGANTRAQTDAPDIDYLFAPLKHARLDYMVQKAVEMGAGRLRPVVTRRTQATRVNLERMRANAIEAAEQCGVLAVPQVLAATSLDHVLASWDDTRALIVCDEDVAVADPIAALRDLQQEQPRLALLIGPEGGFDPTERASLVAHRAVRRVSLGPRILRADTAAVAGLTLLQAVLGDWRAAAQATRSRPKD